MQHGRCFLDFSYRVGNEAAGTIGEMRAQTGESGAPSPKDAHCWVKGAGASDPGPFQ